MSDDLNVNPLLLSPLNLAFVGDAVFDLLVREYYVSQANRPVGTLHKLCAQKVCAGSQAKALRRKRISFVGGEMRIPPILRKIQAVRIIILQQVLNA
jgi:ribonuclease-3 family protein